MIVNNGCDEVCNYYKTSNDEPVFDDQIFSWQKKEEFYEETQTGFKKFESLDSRRPWLHWIGRLRQFLEIS